MCYTQEGLTSHTSFYYNFSSREMVKLFWWNHLPCFTAHCMQEWITCIACTAGSFACLEV